MININCKHCKKVFKIYPSKIKDGRGIYCSKKCSILGKTRSITSKCKNCNNPFKIQPSRIRYGWGKFCSDACRLKHQKNSIHLKLCSVCNTKFKVINSNLKKGWDKFCSNKCKYIGCKKRQKNPFQRSNVLCKQCNVSFNIPNSKIKYGGGKYCSKQCYTQWTTDQLSNGNLQLPYTKSHRGKYYSKLNKEWFYYDSSYELLRMKQLDLYQLPWTKKHGIKIPYFDKNGISHYYIPDFLINNKIIEEVKPAKLINSNYVNNNLKIKAGKKYCKDNNLFFRTITEKELFI